jgi:hypothetical protein
MSFDIERFDDDNQARLRERLPGVTVGSVESVEEALLRQGPVPFIGTLYAGGSSPDGRLVSGQKDQRIQVKASFVIVADSWRSRDKGRDGALALLRRAKNALVTRGQRAGDWVNAQAEGPFIYDEDNFMQRAGQRVAYQLDLHAHVHDDFND